MENSFIVFVFGDSFITMAYLFIAIGNSFIAIDYLLITIDYSFIIIIIYLFITSLKNSFIATDYTLIAINYSFIVIAYFIEEIACFLKLPIFIFLLISRQSYIAKIQYSRLIPFPTNFLLLSKYMCFLSMTPLLLSYYSLHKYLHFHLKE